MNSIPGVSLKKAIHNRQVMHGNIIVNLMPYIPLYIYYHHGVEMTPAYGGEICNRHKVSDNLPMHNLPNIFIHLHMHISSHAMCLYPMEIWPLDHIEI